MATFSPLPTYLIGTLCLTLGVNGLFRPEAEYPRFGLPLEPPPALTTTTTTRSGTSNRSTSLSGPPSPTATSTGTVSPLIYLKSIREITYGLALLALQYQGEERAITTLAAVISLAGLGDGFVVWAFGGERRGTALNHWGTFVGLLGWAAWRGGFV
ncbi:hypothetical protein ASPCAL01083 [Aspergillus calidoustus]|uniref:Integral membrane protein n=1 Tax=Aspergillus calidoustus TaxID=454130 RepID=A0A0U5FSI9_ASPCI|nr:hypothetical protein ASPCAL01083 [Aspergillus calidoustus]